MFRLLIPTLLVLALSGSPVAAAAPRHDIGRAPRLDGGAATISPLESGLTPRQEGMRLVALAGFGAFVAGLVLVGSHLTCDDRRRPSKRSVDTRDRVGIQPSCGTATLASAT